MTFGESEKHQRNQGSTIAAESTSVGIAPTATKKPSQKLSCWNCYKLYFRNEESDKYAIDSRKTFCTAACYDSYHKANSETCRLVGCGKVFLKANKPYVAGKWFCCDEHAE